MDNLLTKKILTSNDLEEIISRYHPMEISDVVVTGEPTQTKIVLHDGSCSYHYTIDNLNTFTYGTYVDALPADSVLVTGPYYNIAYTSAHGSEPVDKVVRAIYTGAYTLVSADVPTLTASGYSFKGWYVGAKLMSVGSTIMNASEFVAKWLNSYVLTYTSTYGTAPSAKDVEADDSGNYSLTTEDIPTLTAEGHVFTEWQIDGIKANVGDIITADTALVAVWAS